MIAGVGPGLGSSLSRRFAKEYKVVLLARSKGTLDSVTELIKKDGGDVDSSMNQPNMNSLWVYRQIVLTKQA